MEKFPNPAILGETGRNPSSDVHFALQLRNADYFEQLDTLFGGEKFVLDMRELSHLVAWVIMPENAEGCLWQIPLHENEPGRFLAHDGNNYIEAEKLSSYFKSWHEFVVPQFRSRFRHDLKLHLCVQEFLNRGPIFDLIYDSDVKRPTAHERLEAYSKLREWIEQNAPEKMNQLLPPLS